MILLVDNYDSFTYNLAHLFGELGAEVLILLTPDDQGRGRDRAKRCFGLP